MTPCLDGRDRLSPGGCAALNASPALQLAAPSSKMSLITNAPAAEGTIRPSTWIHMPGVVIMKLSVVRNMPAAARLPTAQSRAEMGRAAISSAMTISAEPIIRLAPCSLVIA